MSLEIALGEEIYHQQRTGQRTGQAIMNALHTVSPALAALVPEDVDPFYQDSLIPAFWEWFYVEISEGWNQS
jgi:hypothetical protein